MTATFCPRCHTARVGAFRYCRSCAFDFDGLPSAEAGRSAGAAVRSEATQDLSDPQGSTAAGRVSTLQAILRTALVLAALTSVAVTGNWNPGTRPAISAQPTPTGAPTAPPSAAAATPTARVSPVPVLGASPIEPTERAVVVRVVDGDTIVIDRGRGEERLRYIGIDSPETAGSGAGPEFMGPEATAANTALVGGREVVLESDITEYDPFDRLLRYVWIEDPSAPTGWTLVNLALVASGFANVATFPPDVRYVDLLLGAEASARAAGLGVWGDPPATPTATPSATLTPAVATPPARSFDPDCDPSYPTVCIPPPPPILSCDEIVFHLFDVLPPDPHGFDPDRDGIGCES